MALHGVLSSYTTRIQIHAIVVWPSTGQPVNTKRWLTLFTISPLHGFNYYQLAPAAGEQILSVHAIASQSKLHFTLHAMAVIKSGIMHSDSLFPAAF